MATKKQCRKCIHTKDCPILESLREKGEIILQKMCESYKDKK